MTTRPASDDSLYGFIRSELQVDGSLADPTMVLPDAESEPNALRWIAGAHDAVRARLVDVEDAYLAAVIAELIISVLRNPAGEYFAELLDALVVADAVAQIDTVIEHAAELRADTRRLADLGTRLAAKSAHRGPVKVGIALVGVTGAPDGSLLHELGAHEEFTVYAADAFCHSRENPEPDLCALARRVHGWGRVHCVERLEGTSDPEIQDWILRGGYRNSVGESLTGIAATTGRLADALSVDRPDRGLLDVASDILFDLIADVPAPSPTSWPDAPVAFGHYLAHMGMHAQTVDD